MRVVKMVHVNDFSRLTEIAKKERDNRGNE